jgi:hypothetical protein
MRRRGTLVLVVVGICWLCFAGTVFAAKPPPVPEIDVGSAAGALTIAGGVLTLLGERRRRQ